MFEKYGMVGNIREIDIICSISINIVMDKIFLFTWCYYAILGIGIGINLLKFILLAIPRIRIWYIRRLLHKCQVAYGKEVTDVTLSQALFILIVRNLQNLTDSKFDYFFCRQLLDNIGLNNTQKVVSKLCDQRAPLDQRFIDDGWLPHRKI